MLELYQEMVHITNIAVYYKMEVQLLFEILLNMVCSQVARVWSGFFWLGIKFSSRLF
jgi:hypothetical protein